MLRIGDIGLMKSSTQGGIRVRILDYSDILSGFPGMVVTQGSVTKYQVHFLEGKHTGEIQWVPANYVTLAPYEHRSQETAGDELGEITL